MKHPTTIFTFLIMLAALFAGIGMHIPPLGVIDGSVLIFTGQIFLLAAGVVGFTANINIKEGKFSIDKEENNEHKN